ncbi:MAG TPA: vWA domain-containing protein [Myxococcales bacterium]
MRWLGLAATAALGILASVPARAEKCPNMLILLDRSGSMTDPKPPPAVSKWSIAVQAVNAFVPPRQSVMRFGLAVFPSFTGDGCTPPSDLEVSCEFYNADAIAHSLSSGDPGGNTPTSAALDQAAALPDLTDGTRRRFIVLLTDGDPTCPGSDKDANTTLAVNSLNALRANGIQTFVIGFGTDVGPARLDRMAAAGGVPRVNGTCANPANPTGPRIACKYYDASDLPTLNATFDEIASVAQGELQGNSCDDSCYVIGACPAGQRCTQSIQSYDQGKYRLNLGQCVSDPCATVVCGSGKFCREGACVDTCSAPCPSGKYCDRGTCADDPCATGLSCVCTQGCDKFLVCLSGTCQDDPCRYVTCPSTAPYCDRGSCYPASAPLVPADAGTVADAGGGGSGGGCSASGAGPGLALVLALVPLLAFRLGKRR